MSPEEHLRRLRSDDVWEGEHPQAVAPTARSAQPQGQRRDRGPIWATAVVAAALVGVTLAALNGVGSAHPGEAAGPAASTASSVPTRVASPAPTPSGAPSEEESDPSLRQFLFYPDDPADAARAKTIITCFKRHGVRIVGLEPAEGDSSAMGISFGGPKNDHESIVKGLQFSKECFKAGGPVR